MKKLAQGYQQSHANLVSSDFYMPAQIIQNITNIGQERVRET
jgi:hypothetical protein